MSANLLKAFSLDDFRSVNKKTSDLMELSFAVNKVSGAKFARAVFDDGVILVKNVSENEKMMQFPPITSIEQRTEIIKELSKNYTQLDIAAILDVSQATVSQSINAINRKENYS